MEDTAPIVFGDLNKNICRECGLPLKVYSYEKINQNSDYEEIKLKLFCQNLEHKIINEFDFKDYQLLVNEYLDKICKCTFCNTILINTNEITYYCYLCKKILCSNCLNDKHDKEHKNVFKYDDLQNKCLIHFDNKNENKYYCIICKKFFCANCLLDDLNHPKEHNVKEIDEFKKNIKDNIYTIENELDKNKNEKLILEEKLNILNNKIMFNEFLLKEKDNYYHLIYDYNNNLNNKNSNMNINNDNNDTNNNRNNK